MQPMTPDGGPTHKSTLRQRIAWLIGALVLANLTAWLWALAAFHAVPVLLGTAALAWGLGLRHAVDADHIAAIDNVTRKLMQDGQRPVGVGLFFSLGHASVVVLASAAVALTAGAFRGRIEALHALGGTVGTLVSAGFLLVIAAVNMVVLHGIWRRWRAGSAGPDELAAGLLTRLFRPAFGLVRHSWHMYPLGFLFGLGFDTASEVALLGMSAAEATRALPIWSIMVFPALFTAGMALIDTADGMLMLGAYGWAFVRPARKLAYNLTITAVSVLVALLVGGIEVLGLVGPQQGPVAAAIAAISNHSGAIGFAIIGLSAMAWAVSALLGRGGRIAVSG